MSARNLAAAGLIGAAAMPGTAAQSKSVEAPPSDLQPNGAVALIGNLGLNGALNEGDELSVIITNPLLREVEMELRGVGTLPNATASYHAVRQHHHRQHKPHLKLQKELVVESLNRHPHVVAGSDAKNAFTPDWWRCVIRPESSGRFDITSGAYGILVSTWHAYGMSGVPGNYPPVTQARIALEIYHDNGGFGPGAWNNTANCGKNG